MGVFKSTENVQSQLLNPANHQAASSRLLVRRHWIEQCFTSPPTQYRLYGRRFLQVKRPNQQYQSTERTNSTQTNQTYNKQIWTQNTASPRVYTNMGWLGDGFHRGQGCQAWTAVGLPPRYLGDRKSTLPNMLLRRTCGQTVDDAWQIVDAGAP